MRPVHGFIRLLLLALLASPLVGCLASLNGWELWLHPGYKGEVLDAESGQPVAEAQVTWIERGLTAKTDQRGHFMFEGQTTRKHIVPFGDVGVIYTFRVSSPLYAEQEVKNFYVKYAPAEKPEIVHLDPVRLQKSRSGTETHANRQPS